MNHLLSKLHDDRGSSMILALFLMLVAVMVSSTILASAATAARSVSYGVDRQQSYLTVSSAATALRDTILDSGGGYEKTTIRVDGQPNPIQKTTPVSGCYGSELQTMVEDLIRLDSSSVSREYWILVDGFDPVGMKLVLKKDDANQKIQQEDETKEVPCTLTATFSNVLEKSTAGLNIVYTPPATPVRIVVVIHGSMKRTVRETKVNQQNVMEIIDTMTWDPKRIQIQKTAPEGTLP